MFMVNDNIDQKLLYIKSYVMDAFWTDKKGFPLNFRFVRNGLLDLFRL